MRRKRRDGAKLQLSLTAGDKDSPHRESPQAGQAMRIFRQLVRKFSAGVALAMAAGAPAFAANPWALEAGRATTNNTAITPSFITVNFTTAFATAPVVVVLPTNRGGDPATLRIRNITASGFQVAPVEPTGNDGPHVAMTFDFVAMTPGVHVMPGGETVVAGTHSTSTVQHGTGVAGVEGWDTVSFGATLSGAASVIAGLQTMNGETGTPPGGPSIPWLTVAMRNPSASTVQLALERSEAAPGTVGAETIGFIAFAAGAGGSFLDDGGASTSWSAVTTADNIRGWGTGGNCFTNTYSAAAFASPHVVATKVRHDGGDGGWLRRCSLSGTSIGLVVDEDIFRDAERNHTTEAAGVLAFSRAFHAVFEGLLTAVKSVTIEEDPVNGASGPLAIPGARARYVIDVQSVGKLPVDNDTVSFVDALPPQTSLIVTDIAGPGSGPVRFTDGATTSALTYAFTSLASTTDDLAFSSNGGASFTYTPTPGANGEDPAVTHIRVEPKGSFAGDGAGPNPSFTLEFDVIVE